MNKENYIKILESINDWPKWKKELCNKELLVSINSIKLKCRTED